MDTPFREDVVRNAPAVDALLANAPSATGRSSSPENHRVTTGGCHDTTTRTMGELFELTIDEARQRLARREISSTELTRAVLDRIEQTEPAVRSFITVTRKRRWPGAAAGRAAGARRCTAAVRDSARDQRLILTQGSADDGGVEDPRNFIPPYHATVTRKLSTPGRCASARPTATSLRWARRRRTRLCRDPQPVESRAHPGGSSGGSAARSRRGSASLARPDTGGSIRQPAAIAVSSA